MKVSSINTTFSSHNLNKKSANKQSFNGVTIYAQPYLKYPDHIYGGSGSPAPTTAYRIPEGAVPTPNYAKILSYNSYIDKSPKIYRADPFEIIPKEIYETHDYILRDDLRFSQIKNDYKKDFQNFAQNAENEYKFLKYKHDELEPKVQSAIEEVMDIAEKIEFASKKYGNRHKQNLEDEFQNAKENLKTKKDEIGIYKENLQNAKERYRLLKELDDVSEMKNRVQARYNYIIHNYENIASQKIYAKELEEQLFFLGERQDNIVSKIEKLYKEKYPNWL